MLTILAILLLCRLARCSDCAPSPISVPVGNVTLSNGKVAQGLNISLGTPPQPMAFMPLWPLNNTVVYGVDGYCLSSSTDPWSAAGCTTFRGGAYNALASTTRSKSNASAFPDDSHGDAVVGDASSGGAHYPASTYVADTLHLAADAAVDAFPLRIAQSDWGEGAYTPMMGLGLGTNSTLTHLLRGAGRIASRSWSFFWGQNAVGGSFVLGGYDRAKVSGTQYTLPLTPGVAECPSQLLVTIADLVLNFPNGTDASIFPGARSSALTACITPGLPTLMRLPLDPYFGNFLGMTDNAIDTMDRSTGVFFWNMRYRDGFLPYGGDVTIKIQGGPAIRIPNQQLVVPHAEIDRASGDVRVNTTGPDLLFDSLQDVEKDKLAQLGRQFLTAAYLMVNQDAAQFSLWAANPTADEDLVAVDAAGGEATVCSASGGSTSTSGGSSTPASTDTPTQAKTPTAVIAGAAVGGVCAAVLLAGGVTLLLLRRRRARADRAAFARFEDASRDPSTPPPADEPELVELGAGKGGSRRATTHAVYEAPAHETQGPLEKWPASPRYEMAA